MKNLYTIIPLPKQMLKAAYKVAIYKISAPTFCRKKHIPLHLILVHSKLGCVDFTARSTRYTPQCRNQGICHLRRNLLAESSHRQYPSSFYGSDLKDLTMSPDLWEFSAHSALQFLASALPLTCHLSTS